MKKLKTKKQVKKKVHAKWKKLKGTTDWVLILKNIPKKDLDTFYNIACIDNQITLQDLLFQQTHSKKASLKRLIIRSYICKAIEKITLYQHKLKDREPIKLTDKEAEDLYDKEMFAIKKRCTNRTRFRQFLDSCISGITHK